MLTFYHSTQTCSTAVAIALAEAGLEFKEIEVSWQRNLNVDALAAVNPLGQVPTLVVNGKSLIQTISILEYIADQAPEKQLLPALGTWERTEANAWLAFIGADFQKGFLPIGSAKRWLTDGNAQAELKSKAVEGVTKHLAYLEKSLAGKDYLLGKKFSVADAYLFTILGWCKWAEVKLQPFPGVVSYVKRVLERSAVKRALERDGLQDFLPA